MQFRTKTSVDPMMDGSNPKSRVAKGKAESPNNNRSAKQAAKATSRTERRDDAPHPNVQRDNQVHVNLAMADLMAYLQVVANNSSNLPLTRRDDPELQRMVSSLTNEEYARKSAAFIPADVRMIGATFTKYGRVWDLPTSDEYNAQDGAQEPGRSYGGACGNAMLKVLYDAANEATDAAQTMEATNALFDDDDDDEASLSNNPAFQRNSTFASLDMNEHSNPSTISWVELLRKMKAEIKEIEYPQTPMITSTRKLDLNQPFSLIPEGFDASSGKKRSLLIGSNYSHVEGAQLKASHDDIRSMKDYIVNVHGFPETEGLMTVLMDDAYHRHPTFHNITEAFKALSEESQPGDAVFIHFTGHGGRILDGRDDSEAESYDEFIVPTDYDNNGLIRDTLMFKTLLAPMRYGVTVTVIADCCDTGMVLDLPYSWSTRVDKPGGLVKMTQNDDFSFVRFLKVVKTLYESSTFTQLGKTVGSALGYQSVPVDDGSDQLTENNSQDEDKTSELQTRKQASLFSFLGMCSNYLDDGDKKDEKHSKKKKQKDDLTLDTGDDSKSPATILEQVMNCTLMQNDEVSDEGSYKSTGTFDDFDDSTFESMTDDEKFERARKKESRGRSRRRRR